MKKNACLLLMNTIYYLAVILLVLMLILPHTSIYYRWDVLKPFAEKVNNRTVYLIEGERYKINLFGINKRVTYRSSDFKVAEVSSLGIVFAHKAGKTVIFIKQGEVVNKYRIYVLKLNRRNLSVRVSKSRKLIVVGKRTGVRWKSSNKSIVTVSRFGKVTGRKKGNAYVIAVVKGKKLKCKITVK